MATFADDMIRLNLVTGVRTISCKALGFDWPPPERIYLGSDGKCREATDTDDPGFVLHRESMSQISDDERASMTHVVRGAEYEYRRDT